MTANPLRAARGTTATLNTRVLKDGELAYNTTTDELHVGDGVTLGGRPISSEVDGDDIDVTATGSTTARSLADRFAEQFHVADYGAVGDGTTNDAPAIIAAIAAAAAKGGGDIIFEPLTYAIAAEIAITTPSIHLYGRGGDKVHTVGTVGAQAATELKWTGSAGGTIISFTSPTGASNQIIFGGGVEDMYLNGQASGGVGIKIRSLWGGRFRDLLIYNFTTAQVDVGVVGTLGESESTQHCTFEDMNLRATSAAPSADGFLLDGDYTTVANTSLCRFDRCSVFVYNGTAYNLQNCDNNFFESCRAYVTGSGSGVVMHGSNTAVQDIARNNVFMHFSGDSSATIVAKGTATYTYPSYGNRFFCIDNDNNVAIPTIETGATCYWDRTDGLSGGGRAFVKLALGDNITNADDARDDQTTETLVVRNNSENHMLLAKGDGTLPWKQWIQNSTGDLVFGGGAGTRHVQFALQAGGALIPNADNIFSLGIAANGWSDLFLGSGAVVNFNNGDVTITHSSAALAVAHSNDGAAVGPLLYLDRVSASAATNDLLGRLVFRGRDDAGNATDYAYIESIIIDPVNGVEDGALRFVTINNGAAQTYATLRNANFRINASTLSPDTSDGSALGATTLMWSDLFLASGAVINFDNGDVTLTHATNQLTFTGGLFYCVMDSLPLQVRRNNDSSSLAVAIFEGDRATPTNNDTAYISLRSSNDAGTQIEICRDNWVMTSITAGSERGVRTWGTMNAGVLATRLALNESTLYPNTNDGLALGGTSNNWSDLFLASGAVINFNNGDVTITHSTDALTFAGAANGFVFNQHILSGAHIKAHQSTAIPAGGTTGAGFTFSSATNFGVFFGSGAPTLSAAQGSLYLRSDGSSTSTRLYVNTDGGTTWTNVVTAA